MDIDRYIAQNQPAWARLASLTATARSRPTAFQGDELAEFLRLYQLAGTQLSFVRTTYKDPALTAQLTRQVAAAAQVLYGRRPRTLATARTFFEWTFPAIVYHNRWFVGLASLLFFAPATLVMVWLLNSPEALDVSASPVERSIYAQQAFASYYSEQPSAQFAALVGVNNVFVSFIAFIGGAAAMGFGAYTLINNGVAIGQAGAWMISEGEAVTFWTLIAPHGLLELSSIILAGAAGLRVGWTIFVPGPERTRSQALTDEGRRAGAMALGLIAFFGLSALIEGFITGSSLPIEVRIGIGVLIWGLFVTYIVVQGRTALASGYRGLPHEPLPGSDPSLYA